jgi:hypothetical protein
VQKKLQTIFFEGFMRYFSRFCLGLIAVSNVVFAHGENSCKNPCWCPVEVDLTLALDDFRDIGSGSCNDSFGALAALNFFIPLPASFSTQLAGSYGLYDWAGRSSTQFKNSKTWQQQGFITVAASRVTPYDCGLNVGVAYDWVLNKNFGLFAVNPFFDQIRGQFGYLFRGGNEIGAWGSYGIRTVDEESQSIPLQFKGISQVNLFWCHYFKSCGYGMLWLGTPYQRGLMYTAGRAGRFIFGAQFSVPVTSSLSIEGHGSYMAPRGGSGVVPSRNYGTNLCFGITYSFGNCRTAKSPYMTLANNTNFMTDTNQNY